MRPVDLLNFAFGSLRGHRLRALFSLLGVAIGVGSVILLTSLGEGARLYVTGEFASLGTNLLIVIPGKTETSGGAPLISTAPHDLTVEDAAALLRRIPSIRRVAPVAIGSVTVEYGERQRDVTIIGTSAAYLEVRNLKMGIGRFLPPGEPDAPVCVIGATLQRELFADQNPLGKMVRIGESRFRVIGVLASRGTSIGVNLDEIAHIPVDSALRLFNRASLFRILAEMRTHADIDRGREQVLAVLTERHDGQEDITVLTQDAVLATFNKILGALTMALAGIAAISLTVAGIGIMNVMLVSVSERTREIGLLKALGASARQILSAFLLEAALISTTGGLAGLLTGLLASQAVQRIISGFPAQPPQWAVLAALIVSVSVGLLFGSLPARKAARLDPVVALTGRRR